MVRPLWNTSIKITEFTELNKGGVQMRDSNRNFSGLTTLLVMLILGACQSLMASSNAAPQSVLEGFWITDGYGLVIEIKADHFQLYEITAVSCLPSLSGTVKLADQESGDDELIEALIQIPVDNVIITIEVLAGASPDHKRFHFEHAASNILARRISEFPVICEALPPNTPDVNFDIFWQTYLEHYPFFAMKGVDWEAVRREIRPRITDETTEEELFEIFQKMVEPLEDAHTFFWAPSLNRSFAGRRPGANPLTNEDKARSVEIIETNYLCSPVLEWANGHVAFGMLRAGVGYLRTSSFSDYTTMGDFRSGAEALETALDEIFGSCEKLEGLVIDIRTNGGGIDLYGLAIANRLTKHEYFAYTKQARNDPTDPNKWTEDQPSLVRPSRRPDFFGPVILLTGHESGSAAETFTMALMGRTPRIIRIGQNTQGVFSDVQRRTIPNGWFFWLPNERFLTEDGDNFDGPGIPPHIAMPVFSRSDLDSGKDGGLEKALEILTKN